MRLLTSSQIQLARSSGGGVGVQALLVPPTDPRGVIRIARKLYLKNSILRDNAIEQKR
jgi:hypothetical protein